MRPFSRDDEQKISDFNFHVISRPKEREKVFQIRFLFELIHKAGRIPTSYRDANNEWHYLTTSDVNLARALRDYRKRRARVVPTAAALAAILRCSQRTIFRDVQNLYAFVLVDGARASVPRFERYAGRRAKRLMEYEISIKPNFKRVLGKAPKGEGQHVARTATTESPVTVAENALWTEVFRRVDQRGVSKERRHDATMEELEGLHREWSARCEGCFNPMKSKRRKFCSESCRKRAQRRSEG